MHEIVAIAMFARNNQINKVTGTCIPVSLILLFALIHTATTFGSDPEDTPEGSQRLWRAHIQPLLSQHCFKCHGELKQKADLDLRTPAKVLTGGDNGPAIKPGDPKESLLYQVVLPNADPHMPPKDYQLTQDEISLLSMWIAGLSDSPVELDLNSDANWTESPADLVQPNEPNHLPPAHLHNKPSQVIDYYIERRLEEKNTAWTEQCDDLTFVRRIYLDLAGRIPTSTERDSFVSSRDRQKRTKLIESLLASKDYPRRMREVFDYVLLKRPRKLSYHERVSSKWNDYLEWVFATNRSWNNVVEDLLLARPKDEQTQPAVWFQYERNNNHQKLIESISPALLGVQIQCAQCHNHPLAPEIKQAHYWGMVAFFNRSKNVETPKGLGIAESAIGGFVKYATLEKESLPAYLTFFDGNTIEEKRPGDNDKEKDSPENYLVAYKGDPKKSNVATVPKFSRRAAFVKWACEDNPLVARAFVNRMWALLMGRGLVHPVDIMDSSHPPSHPDLLAWLARDFETNGYDVKRLIRILTQSHTYQRRSVWNGDTSQLRPTPDLFAFAIEKPLTAEVIYRSLRIATGNSSDAAESHADWDQHQKLFLKLFPEVFPVDYNATLWQALFFTNNPLLDELIKPKEGNTAARIADIPGPRQQIEEAFLTVLGRPCDTEEMKHALAFYATRLDEPEKAQQQVLWALLTSAEFVFNH